MITPSKNLWHCLGACQAGGSVIDWVMKAEGVCFRHAVELLRAESALLTPPPAAAVTDAAVREAPGAGRSADADDQELLAQVVGYYHETLKQSPEALAYLERRGLRSLGDDRPLQARASRTARSGCRLPRSRGRPAARCGGGCRSSACCARAGHEHFNGSLVIPIFDEEGDVAGMYGRKITRRTCGTGTPLHLYLPGPHRGVWNVEALAGGEEIILCEALIDALTFWCARLPQRHLELRRRGLHRGPPRGVQALRDRAGADRLRPRRGRRARRPRELADKLMADGHRVLPGAVSRGMDANEYALQGDAGREDRWSWSLKSAVWHGQGRAPPRGAASETAARRQPRRRRSRQRRRTFLL